MRFSVFRVCPDGFYLQEFNSLIIFSFSSISLFNKLIISLFIGYQVVGYSQVNQETLQVEAPDKTLKNELKLNLGMIFLGLPELSYERIFANNQSVSVSAAISLREEMNSGTKYMISSQYRLYFGKKRANGFFMEFNTTLLEERVNSYYYPSIYNSYYSPSSFKVTKFGFGLGAGAKFITKNNMIGEFNLGFGSNILRNKDVASNAIYPRLGFSIGKRF